jgi:formylglycine-generating enzyme required for sulfatase activity
VSLRLDGTGYYLPSEAQWEYAGRAGVTGATYAQAGQSLSDIAWYSESFNGTTHPVESKAANPWGLHMLGNVWEWAGDRCGPYSVGSHNTAVVDPLGPEAGMRRVIRGGGWNSAAHRVRLAARGSGGTASCYDNSLGFRPARSVPLVP